MKLRALIVDDERLSRERLRGLLADEFQVEILGECANGREALEMIRTESPEVVFLDVKMPELGGFGVVEKLRGRQRPAIVFVTAHDQFAVQAFEFHAVDYLLKPFDRERLRQALERVREHLRTGTTSEYAALLDTLASRMESRPKRLERVTIKLGHRTIWVKTEEIDWISAADNYVELHVSGAVHCLRATIAAISDQLPEQAFVRISRSCLVNVERIREIRSRPHGDYLVGLNDGTELTGTRNFRDSLERVLGRSK